MNRIAGSQIEEDRTLQSRDSCTSTPEDLPLDSRRSLEEIENMEEQGPGAPWGVNLRNARTPTVTELWPEFHHGKPLRFLRLFDTQKRTSRWQEVRKRLRRRKKQKGQCPPKPALEGPQSVRSPDPEECLTDDEIKMIAPVAPQPGSQLSDPLSDPQTKEVAQWRYGPARLWYDMLGVPPHGRGFDYGFKLKEKSPEEEESIQTDHPLLKDENFLMVTQKSWEDDIIWDNRDIENSFPDAQKVSQAGWIPSEKTRFFETGARDPSKPGGSIFVPENEELIHGQWEDNIIWDAQAIHKPFYPTVLTIDPDDENLLLYDIEEPQEVESPASRLLTQKQPSESSQIMPKCGIRSLDEAEQTPVQLKAKDPWNLSNDEFYFPCQHGLQVSFRDPIIQHSAPAMDLHCSLFPTHLGPEQLRLFHRPPVRWLGKGPQPVHSLTYRIQKKAQEWQKELQASGGGHMFFMKTIQDLSGQDGDLILVEWSEENPPLLNQVGMASIIQNYYKRENGKDPGPSACKYGNLVFCSSSPFLGQLHAGQLLQALENKLFRAPIYPHQMADTDFLVVVTKAGYFLREVKDIFTVGQQCPLYEVPAPNSKMAVNCIHEFLQVFIYRQFWKSPYRPRRIHMEDIHRAFPGISENSIRRRLTRCSDFHRTGMYFNWWVLKDNFCLPSEEELRDMLTPEKCCALYSMLASQQRLRDAGYEEVALLNKEKTSDEIMGLEDEIQAAPWNTTQAFLAATKGQCLLEVTGVADPTGCGEGISYVKVACKSKQENKTSLEARKVMGTDADLRRLTLKEAQKLLRMFGMSEEEIKKLSRWEVIGVIRDLSTKELHSETKTKALTKFARGPHPSGAEQQRHYQQNVQRIFDLQNKVLASNEVLSTDTESSSSDEESDHLTDLMCQKIEDLLEGKTNPQRLQKKKENSKCQEKQHLMLRDEVAHLLDKSQKEKQNEGSTSSVPVSLVIHRTYIDESGREYVQSERIWDPAVIKAYVHVRNTKDEQKQQEYGKQKKRFQNRSHQKKKKKDPSHQKLPKPEIPASNLICGNCGSLGHIKINKMCPNRCKPKNLNSKPNIMTWEQEEKDPAEQLPMKSFIKSQGTKISLKEKQLEMIAEFQKETSKLRSEKRPLDQKTQSGPPQKRRFVQMDPDESLSCIQHPWQPAPPHPPSRRQSKSHLVLSPHVPLEKSGSIPPGKHIDKPLQNTGLSQPTLSPQVSLEKSGSSPSVKHIDKPLQKTEKWTLTQKSQSGPAQKRQFMQVEPDKIISCIRHPCRPAPPRPSPRRHTKPPHKVLSSHVPLESPTRSLMKNQDNPIHKTQSPHPVLSPQDIWKRPETTPSVNHMEKPLKNIGKWPSTQKSHSAPPQKRRFVPMDPDESVGCIRHPCQPAPPRPPSRRHSKSHLILSPQVPLEKLGDFPSLKHTDKPLQKTGLSQPVMSPQTSLENSGSTPVEQKAKPLLKIEKQPLHQKSQSDPPQKRRFVQMDPDDSMSCIRHPCHPAPLCPPSRRHTKSPPPVLCPHVPLEKPASIFSRKHKKSLYKTQPPLTVLSLQHPLKRPKRTVVKHKDKPLHRSQPPHPALCSQDFLESPKSLKKHKDKPLGKTWPPHLLMSSQDHLEKSERNSMKCKDKPLHKTWPPHSIISPKDVLERPERTLMKHKDQPLLKTQPPHSILSSQEAVEKPGNISSVKYIDKSLQKTEAPHPILSPKEPSERPQSIPVLKHIDKSLQNTLLPPIQSAQSEPEPPSQPLRKDWSLQNWLQNKYKSLTQPREELHYMDHTQNPELPLPKSKNPLTCSKQWMHDSSGQPCKNPRISQCQPDQKLEQESRIVSKQVLQDILGRSLERPLLNKDTQYS